MTRKYTAEEKRQLIQNLDIEVEHRVRQLEEWLAVALDNFRLHQEGLISRIPKVVRAVSMGDFADKYYGDVQACLRGIQAERMGGTTELEIDRDTRKRKWAAAQEEVGASGHGDGDARTPKNARIMSPKKQASPHKMTRSFVPVRSPVKQPQPHLRPPTSATFNPTMPPKAPTYPSLRTPRHDEHMLSVNGSPLANPYTLGLNWFAKEDDQEKDKGKGKGKQRLVDDRPRTLRRIVIRRDPSVNLASSSSSSQTQPHSQQPQRPNAPTRTQSLASAPSALVSIPTKDGHLLEFDPLTTSPRALDKLVGITDSAKKQAREEMARLVKEAVRKWVIE